MTDKNEKGWPRVAFSRSMASRSSLGIDLYVDAGRPLTSSDESAIYDAVALLEREIGAESARLRPDNIAWKAAWLIKARQLFAEAGLGPVYMKEIDNKYCGAKCCPHRVWLLVTTRLGVIEIGWRKHVLSIDWSGSDVTATAEELFTDEKVTKDGRLIHAWSYDKAAEYLARIAHAQSARD